MCHRDGQRALTPPHVEYLVRTKARVLAVLTTAFVVGSLSVVPVWAVHFEPTTTTTRPGSVSAPSTSVSKRQITILEKAMYGDWQLIRVQGSSDQELQSNITNGFLSFENIRGEPFIGLAYGKPPNLCDEDASFGKVSIKGSTVTLVELAYIAAVGCSSTPVPAITYLRPFLSEGITVTVKAVGKRTEMRINTSTKEVFVFKKLR
jgi:hypothetical protein